MRYRCIHRRRSQYPVTMMCRVLQVSRGGYKAWRDRPESKRAATDRELTRVIRRFHTESKGVYGSRNIRLDLKDAGYHYGRHKVARLMRIEGLSGVPKRRFKVTTQSDPSHPVAENLLKQDFKASSELILRQDGVMSDSRLHSRTISQLVDLYNSYGPARRLRTWKGRKADLVALVRIAAKQSTPYGIVEGVSVVR
jgi:putative transposase